jgi:hypothetical protein
MDRMPDRPCPQPASPSRAQGIARRSALLAVLLALLGAGLMLHGETRRVLFALLVAGERRELEPALFQGAPLRTSNGGRDLVYLVSTQSEAVLAASRRPARVFRRDYLHIDVWAIDAANATVAWRKRLRSYEGKEREGRILPAFELLGVDGDTLWINVEGPLGVALSDGHIVADGARIDERNPQLPGKRVDEPGYVAFGRHGLQVTLDDASQWRIDAHDLRAASRDTPVSDPARIVAPALRAATSAFQVRALPMADRWLGLLTDKEAAHLSHPPVVPGRDPDERPGAMQQFLERNHVPPPLHDPLPQPYRLWGARIEQVSAAPSDWPKDWPDRWGTRPQFSDYQVLPESPTFLRAGLLRPHRDGDIPFWYRDPDSVLVLHADKLGEAGRLHLARISGPRGSTVWRAALPYTALDSVMHREADLVLLGHGPAMGASADRSDSATHQVIVRIDIASGNMLVLDLAVESLDLDPVESAIAAPAPAV